MTHAPWPRLWNRRRLILQTTERYLEIDGLGHKFLTYRDGMDVGGPRMHPALADMMRRMRALHPITQEPLLGDDAAHRAELWAAFTQRAREQRDIPLAALSAWELFVLICNVVADGMTYATIGLLEDEAFARDDDDWGAEASPRRSWWRRFGESFDLGVSSLKLLLTADRRSAPELAQRVIRRGFRGMCRHYSVVVQTLFLLAQEQLDAHDDFAVLSVIGTHKFLTPADHAWTWFVDTRTQPIITADLTGADWLLDRQRADSIFNRGFEGTRWNNASAFLLMLLYRYAAHQDDASVELFRAMVDVESCRGQALLYHLAQQTMLGDSLRERISHHLARRSFRRYFPGWNVRLRLAQERRRVTRGLTEELWRSSAPVFDAIGLP